MEPKWATAHQAELDECLEDLYDLEQRILKIKISCDRASDEAEKAEEAQK